MKAEQLRALIKEEIAKTLNEQPNELKLFLNGLNQLMAKYPSVGGMDKVKRGFDAIEIAILGELNK